MLVVEKLLITEIKENDSATQELQNIIIFLVIKVRYQIYIIK